MKSEKEIREAFSKEKRLHEKKLDWKDEPDPSRKIIRLKISFETEAVIKKKKKWRDLKSEYLNDYWQVGDDVLWKTLKIERIGERNAKIGD